MATGQPAFSQQSLRELVDGVLYEHPQPLAAANPLASASLQRVVFQGAREGAWRQVPEPRGARGRASLGPKRLAAWL
jgi:hypothetical protein